MVQDKKNTKFVFLFFFEQNANQIDRKLSEINDARICNSNWFFRARFFSSLLLQQQFRALTFRCFFALLFDHFILYFVFLFCDSLCLLVRFYYFTRIWVLHTKYRVHIYYIIFTWSVLFLTISHYLHLSSLSSLAILFYVPRFQSLFFGVFLSNHVPQSLQPCLCSCVSFSPPLTENI